MFENSDLNVGNDIGVSAPFRLSIALLPSLQGKKSKSNTLYDIGIIKSIFHIENTARLTFTY